MLRVVLAVLSLLAGAGMTAAGALMLAGEQRIQDFDPEARGTIPGSVRFDAEAGRYSVLLGFNTNPDIAEEARCEARLADGSVRRMRGDRQSVSVQGVAATIGDFKAVAGPTEVSCGWAEEGDSREVRFSVAAQRTLLRTVAFVLIGAGVLVILVGALVLWRRRPRPA